MKLRYIIITVLFFSIFKNLEAQNNIKRLQGIWSSKVNSKYYKVFDGKYLYDISDYTSYNNKITINRYFYANLASRL